ncbi:MAG: DsbA family oxidoreductase [Desulfomonilaceae bacterium]
MGKGLVEELKKDFAIQDTWLPFQLRPWTPKEGIPYSVLFPNMDMKQRYSDLNKSGEPFGIRFGERTFLSNSGPALQAGEYARDNGKYDLFHEEIFRAYFTDVLDIGAPEILLSIAGKVGLDTEELQRCLDDGRYQARLEDGMNQATKYGITAVPTFIINETQRIVGVPTLESFREQLERIRQ